jgi:hypothetical protein
MPFHISADDIRSDSLMARRNYYREHVVAGLERRLDWLKTFSPRSWSWLEEERQRVETEIGDAQKIIGELEAELRNMGKDADVLEGLNMDFNSGTGPEGR